MMFTVFGASGFIGSHLVSWLRRRGIECQTPRRADLSVYNHELGHVVYSIGLTADFRERLADTVRAHVCQLLEVQEKGRFESLLYLSSTRIYRGGNSGHEEATLQVNPQDSDDIYNLSKLMGEAICFGVNHPRVRVARLSNIYGGDWLSKNFLTSVIRAAVDDGQIVLATHPDSAKDYLSISDLVPLLVEIALRGQERLYNVASGVNVTARALTQKLESLTGCNLTVARGAPAVSFPLINIARIRREFAFSPAMVLDSLEGLIAEYRLLKTSHDQNRHQE